MNCPCCGIKMTRGWVQSARKVLFTTTKKGSFITNNKNDVVLTANNFISPSCIAYLCGTCKKVVIDYAEKAE